MKKFLNIFYAASVFVGITEAVNRCGEYIDKETLLVRRTTDGKFNAAISDDFAGLTIFGTANGDSNGDAFTVPFPPGVTHYLFTSGDCSKWVKIAKTEIDAALSVDQMVEITVHSSNLNSNSHKIWMNFAKNIGGPIILNTNSDMYGCPVVYAEDDVIFEGCLDKVTLASGKKIHFSPKRMEMLQGMVYCSQRKMRMHLPESTAETDEIKSLVQGWQSVQRKHWIRIRYYHGEGNLWLDKETTRAYGDRIEPSYLNWGTNKPAHSESKPDAMMEWATGQWDNGNSNSECPTCNFDGYHVVCEDTTSPFIRPSPKSNTDEREALIPSWGPEYKVTFEIKPIYKQDEFGNVMHFWAGGNTNPTCGERMPNISKNSNLSKGFTFQTCANGVSTNRYETGGDGDGLILMDWYPVEVGQRNSEGQYQYYIKIRDTEVFTVNNNSPVSLTNVHAFIGTPFDDPPWYQPRSLYYTDIELRNIQAESNGVTTTIQPHGWSWVDEPLVGVNSNGLNVYTITVPTSTSNCYRRTMCNSWGDPHVDGFDGARNDVYDANWYTLVEPTAEAQEWEHVPYFRVSQRTYEHRYVAFIDMGRFLWYSKDGLTKYDVIINNNEPVECEENWELQRFGDRYLCFKYAGISTFAGAVTLCGLDNSMLPLPLNAQENTDYNNYLNSINRPRSWLDGTDEIQEGVWLDSAGNNLTFLPWGSNQPDNKDGNEHFLQYRPDWGGQWNDVPNPNDHVICQKPPQIDASRKIQINNGPKMNLVAQANDDFSIVNVGKFTRISTWFGVDVEFERRKPNRMMLIKTYVQPFWQDRIQGICGDFDCDASDDFDCAESRHTESLTSPDGQVCAEGGNTNVPGESCHGHCRGLCEKHSQECYIECRDYDTGDEDSNPNQCSITPNESTPDTSDATCPTAIEDACDNLIDNLGSEWNACKSDTDATNDIKGLCKFEACLWAGDDAETEMITQVHKDTLDAFIASCTKRDATIDTCSLTIDQCGSNQTYNHCSTCSQRMTCENYLDEQDGLTVTCDDSVTLASCTCDTDYYLDGDTCTHKDNCTRLTCSWTEWADWSSCSVTCGTGLGNQSRVRIGNDACTEESVQTQNCNGSGDACCGTCQAWAAWSTCSVTCGTGTQARSRTCGPDVGCPGATQNRSCDSGVTCVDCNSCQEWSEWTVCSATCDGSSGTGTRTRTQSCGDETCTDNTQTENCNTGIPCVDCNACQEWSEWTVCSATCDGSSGTGTRTRTQSCGDETCTDNSETENCNTGIPCVEDCSVCGAWNAWTSCSVGCGSQSKSRTRTCSPGTCQDQTEEMSCDSQSPIAEVQRANTQCGEYIDNETVLVRRTLGGKFTAATSDDLAGTAVDGSANGRIGSAFSMLFPEGATHYLFTSGDCSKWVKISKTEIDSALAFNGLKKITVHSTNLNSNSHTIWMNFATNAGGPIILNTNSNMYGCPVVYAENDAVFEGCLDKVTLSSGKKIHISPRPYQLIHGAIYCSQRKMRLFLPENSAENDAFYNLAKDWQYETSDASNKFWLRIRYYSDVSLWLDGETENAYQNQIAPSFLNWDTNEPSDLESSRYAGINMDNGKWESGETWSTSSACPGCTMPESMFEPSCLSCGGLHVVCEETSSAVSRPYAHNSFELRENTISTVGPEYKISFDVKQIFPHAYPGVILSFYTKGANHNGPASACGVNSGGYVYVPFVAWLENTKKLRFVYCVNNVLTHFDYEMNRMEWTGIEMGQRLVGGSSYEFYIKISGTEVLATSNSSPLTFTNVNTLIGAKSSAFLHLSDTEMRNIEAVSNGVTTVIEPHGWSWIDQPMVGECKDGLNVYAITVPENNSNCYRRTVCNSWGDPHVDGFDGAQNDVYDANWYTLVEPTLEAQENDFVSYFRVSQRTYEFKDVAFIDIGRFRWLSKNGLTSYDVWIRMNGDRKIQINDGPMIDLIAQTNEDFEVTHSGRYTRINTWFGVEVEFHRRKPNKYMEIKTHLQPFWQSRVQGVCGDFDCNKDNDFDCAESRHTLSLTSPNGQVCQAGGNTQVPGESCPGRSGKYCRGLCEKASSECYIECRDYDTGNMYSNPNQCSITPNEYTPHTDDGTTCPTAIETGCDDLIDNLGSEWDACKADTDATDDIKTACRFEACIWAGDNDETEMISQVHKNTLDAFIARCGKRDITIDTCSLTVDQCSSNQTYNQCSTCSQRMSCEDYLDEQEGSTVTCDDSASVASCTCDTNYYLDGDTCTHKDSCTRQSCFWTEWADWSSCSVTCGTGVGVQSRVRIGNDACSEESVQTQNCNGSGDACCGTCQAWAEWGTCTVTCGTGTQTRSRSCGPDPGCSDATQNRSCDTGVTCSDCTCQDWTAWSVCSATCGTGTRTRSQSCSGDGNCTDNSESENCNTDTCPIICETDCNTWGSWSSCSATCGVGISSRARTCSASAQNANCESSENKNCNTDTCLPNTCVACPGASGAWTEWGPCSKTCGGGTQNRFRMLCGPNCDPEEQLRICSTNTCGSCTSCDSCCNTWSAWGNCSATCDGSQTRTRSCGLYVNCPDSDSQTCGSDCSDSCENDCSIWSSWSDCSVTCGGGYKTKTRNCPAVPHSSSGQTPCPFSNSIACSTESCTNCTAHCTHWSSWSGCSVSCGTGYKTRDRSCSNNLNSVNCLSYDQSECTAMDCPPDNMCRQGLHSCNLKTHRCEVIKIAPYYKCVQKEKECPPGYKPDMNNKCQDINECKKDSKACLGGARCQNTSGSYKCICEMGFEYVKGQGCKDTDECKTKDIWATCGYGDCINTIGSYACKCKPGYVYKANGKGKLECVRDECDDYDPYKNYDPDYGFKCGDCHPVNIARDWVINGFGVAKCTKPNVKCHSCRTQRWSDKLQRKKNKGQKGSKVKGQNVEEERWGQSPTIAHTTPAPYVEKWWLTTQAWQNPTPAPPSVGEGKGAEWIIGCDSNCNGYLDKNEKFLKFKMGSNCVPNLTEKLDCSGTSGGGSGSGGSGFDCGCDPEDVAFKNIVGYGKAKCTKAGKKSGKKSIWTLTCDHNGQSKANVKMGKKCRFKQKYDCIEY